MGSRERELSCIIDLVRAAYPGLPISDQLDLWMAGAFEPPLAFVLIENVAEKGNTLTSYRVIAKARIALHHPKRIENGTERCDPLSPEPLRQLLVSERFSYRGPTDGLFIHIEGATFQVTKEKKDRTDITFEFEYTVPIPREQSPKINDFELESEV
ncbi:hypothetical protein EDM56_04405 [Brevibacillus fluminis]|uniref:Uncharacterized protein n=1 Tax=Brevibacillus fluminis TaxID=511487 RepID=A0A3M8DXP7_9BACL|nr:hypothetical protein [Brevibacillus fluminis]RNB92001.1 hypothetical protein EDM56_04405 [Brevibacillus fluminis]